MINTQLHLDIMLDKFMSTTQKALMCALLSFIEDDGNTAAGVKLKRLAALGGMSPNTVSKHLKKLCAMGRLSIHGRGRSKEYKLKPRPSK